MNKSNNSSTKEKKEKTNQKKNSCLPTHEITYGCVCGAKFETFSTFSQNVSTSSCSQCNPFYTGVPTQEIRAGAIARFRQKFEPKKKS